MTSGRHAAGVSLRLSVRREGGRCCSGGGLLSLPQFPFLAPKPPAAAASRPPFSEGAALADLHLDGFGARLFTLWNPDGQNAFRKIRPCFFRLDSRGEGERPLKCSVRALDAVVASPLFLLLRFAFTGDFQHALAHGDLDIRLGDLGQIRLQNVLLVVLADIHGGIPDPGAEELSGVASKGAEILKGT